MVLTNDPVWLYVSKATVVIISFFGNLLVIFVYLSIRQLRTVTTVFIVSLALSDVLAALATLPSLLPHPSHLEGILGELYCRLVFSNVIFWIAVKASIFNLIAVTLERYLAVCHPILHRRYFNKRKALYAVGIVWLIAILMNLFAMFVVILGDDGGCLLLWSDKTSQAIVGVIVFALTYLIPLTIMCVAYIRMLFALKAQAERLNTSDSNSNSKKRNLPYHRARRNLVETLFIVVATFAVCWTPDQVMYLSFSLGNVPYFEMAVYPYFLLLALGNSCANPVIYGIKNRLFKKGLKHLFGRKNRVGIQNEDLGDEGQSMTVTATHAPGSSLEQDTNGTTTE
ncbi:melatonin receptor type 1B-B-like [Amphiura filiformis]|uniref:melatonin receptor type 1B-B-like n=1 Tax=Amphiura filiformis TaxID=82378 RepID=UPI003B2234AC